MDEDNLEYPLDYPEIPVELVEGSNIGIYLKDKMCFVEHRCMVDNLGNFFIYEPSEPRYFISSTENHIDMRDISDVRKNFAKKDDVIKEGIDEKQIITIAFGPFINQTKYLHLKFDSQELLKIWFENINKLIKQRVLLNPSVLYLLQREYHRLMGIAKCVGKLSVSVLAKNLSSLKSSDVFNKCLVSFELLHPNDPQIIRLSQFSFQKFLDIYSHLCRRYELDSIFKDLTSSKIMLMSGKEFIQFRKNFQKEDINSLKSKLDISKYEPDKKLADKDKISFHGFLMFLLSDFSKIINDSYYNTQHDLTQPLSQYFINSSHNTYLIGFQIYGTSSVEIYRQCLLRGCRSVEIDCWDGPNMEPIVTHGYAMCSDVLFKDVLLAIKESAFINSSLPVIISIENHCSSKYQQKMAQYFKEIFGDILLTEELPNHPIQEGKHFPSPEDLKMKIIIKAKYEKSETFQYKQIPPLENFGMVPKLENVAKSQDSISQDNSQSSASPDINTAKVQDVIESIEKIELLNNTDMIETELQLKSIINYGRAFPFPDLDNLENDKNYIKIVSLSESTGEKYINEKTVEFLA
ncbi:1-phosphatidylinositol 4,5-bisphosphate phosphodiesterase beta-4 [Thelohanellus kitauei]|uniref:Phosphoinositide phospholipase C n=1 Tax=Thelohanellus kitauei TaxID=669202 RepID=A0A0C2IX91_THEKT|nr:1-phosphatidylinositol 4,5-bisphosphate phosphodiesterase beta-4 [Thelohanellus kitauei]